MDRELVAHLAITRLQGRYADIASRQAWSEMQSLVTPDATFSFDLGAGDVLTFVGPDELASFGARACERFTFYQYIPLNTVVSLASKTRATGRAYALEIGVEKITGEWTEFYGLYHDDYAVDHGSGGSPAATSRPWHGEAAVRPHLPAYQFGVS